MLEFLYLKRNTQFNRCSSIRATFFIRLLSVIHEANVQLGTETQQYQLVRVPVQRDVVSGNVSTLALLRGRCCRAWRQRLTIGPPCYCSIESTESGRSNDSQSEDVRRRFTLMQPISTRRVPIERLQVCYRADGNVIGLRTGLRDTPLTHIACASHFRVITWVCSAQSCCSNISLLTGA